MLTICPSDKLTIGRSRSLSILTLLVRNSGAVKLMPAGAGSGDWLQPINTKNKPSRLLRQKLFDEIIIAATVG
ncbi:MAG: hypothetical protein V3U65_12175 [Granulosicoccaceae bacterium]